MLILTICLLFQLKAHVYTVLSLDIFHGNVEIRSLINITDLGIEVSKTLKWILPFLIA